MYAEVLSFAKHYSRPIGMGEMKYPTLNFHQCIKGEINKNKKCLYHTMDHAATETLTEYCGSTEINSQCKSGDHGWEEDFGDGSSWKVLENNWKLGYRLEGKDFPGRIVWEVADRQETTEVVQRMIYNTYVEGMTQSRDQLIVRVIGMTRLGRTLIHFWLSNHHSVFSVPNKPRYPYCKIVDWEVISACTVAFAHSTPKF